MSQTFFSKQDPAETLSRLSLLGSSQGNIIVWPKGSKDKHTYQTLNFNKDRMEIVLDTKDESFRPGDTVLCSFELGGMSFFSEVLFQVSISGSPALQFKNILYKSERRSSYRLLTYPMHEVWAEFDLGEVYEGGNVVSLKNGLSQTNLFKNFLKIVEDKNDSGDESRISIRVQDFSTTGMGIHIGELEAKYFKKDIIFNKVNLKFKDEQIVLPEVKVVYVVDYLSSDKKSKKYKIGLHFENLPSVIDDQIGKKINELLRENNFNKDFENFIK